MPSEAMKHLMRKLVRRVGNACAFPPRLKRRTVVVFVASVALVLTVVFTVSILGQLPYTRTIGSYGMMKAEELGVYWDSNCNNPVSYVNWGYLEPGFPKNVTFYISNEGTDPVVLFLEVENWRPENASNFLALSWNYKGEVVDPNEIVKVTLSLTASQNWGATSHFQFDIVFGCT